MFTSALQLFASMEISGSWMGPLRWKVVWRCALSFFGMQYVTLALIAELLLWLVNNLASPDIVSNVMECLYSCFMIRVQSYNMCMC